MLNEVVPLDSHSRRQIDLFGLLPSNSDSLDDLSLSPQIGMNLQVGKCRSLPVQWEIEPAVFGGFIWSNNFINTARTMTSHLKFEIETEVGISSAPSLLPVNPI